MKTIDRQGTVVEVLEQYATVEVRPEDCGKGKLSCACCSAAGRKERVRVNSAGLSVGDTVVVSTPAYITYAGILVIFVLPLALAVLGGWVGAAVEGGSGAHDMPVIIGGLAGLAAWVPVAMLANRVLTRPENVAVRKLSGAGS
jgi:hypothetical protein